MSAEMPVGERTAGYASCQGVSGRPCVSGMSEAARTSSDVEGHQQQDQAGRDVEAGTEMLQAWSIR